jgi:hypothetical protein
LLGKNFFLWFCLGDKTRCLFCGLLKYEQVKRKNKTHLKLVSGLQDQKKY